jgi:hypothetical protein
LAATSTLRAFRPSDRAASNYSRSSDEPDFIPTAWLDWLASAAML